MANEKPTFVLGRTTARADWSIGPSIGILIGVFIGVFACSLGARAQTPQIPLIADEKEGTVYVNPNIYSTENSMRTQGGTVGIVRPDGSGTYTGVDTSGPRPNYSIGASTGGNVSFSGGLSSDGKDNKGIKAGVTIKY